MTRYFDHSKKSLNPTYSNINSNLYKKLHIIINYQKYDFK